jgi:hypothetical protein
MADVATPPAAKVATADVPVSEKQQVVKPEQPDEAKYKEDLAKAEKEHTAAQEKFVGVSHIHLFTQVSSFPSSRCEYPLSFQATCILHPLLCPSTNTSPEHCPRQIRPRTT